MTSQPTRQARINRAGAVPFYYQLREILLAQIGSQFKEGDLLPSEAELCAQQRVSRTVVRQALDELARDGVVYKVRGKGTFVARPKLESSHVQSIGGFYASMTSQGHNVESEVLRQRVEPATAHVARLLSLDIGEPIVAIDRLRRVDGVSISIVRSWLAVSLCPGLEAVDLRDVSLLAVINERYGLRPHHGNRTIEAIAMPPHDAKLLGVKSGSPALQMESVTRTVEDVPLEYFVSVYRGDSSKLDIELVGR
jgi:Transcriptional regulators